MDNRILGRATGARGRATTCAIFGNSAETFLLPPQSSKSGKKVHCIGPSRITGTLALDCSSLWIDSATAMRSFATLSILGNLIITPFDLLGV